MAEERGAGGRGRNRERGGRGEGRQTDRKRDYS